MNDSGTVLVCWIGGNDLQAADGGDPGPILSTLCAARFARAELLSSYPLNESTRFERWLQQQIKVQFQLHHEPLSSPVDFGEIYQAADKHLARLRHSKDRLAILISPGTPAMQAVWILSAKRAIPLISISPPASEAFSESKSPSTSPPSMFPPPARSAVTGSLV